MSTEIKVPALPESVSDAQVTTWHVTVGQSVEQDQPLVDIETDKVVLEVVSPVNGVLHQINFQEGSTVTADEILGIVSSGEETPSTSQQEPEKVVERTDASCEPASHKIPVIEPPANELPQIDKDAIQTQGLSPSKRRQSLDGEFIGGSHPVQNTPTTVEDHVLELNTNAERGQRREKMTRLRQKIAQRLLDAQSQAAMLTTFNEICMEEIMTLRAQYKEEFEKRHQIKLGYMSLFTKAVCHALEKFPAINASIDGDDIVYHDFCDISIAVSSPRGLVVPVVRDAHRLSVANIERSIMDLSVKARDGLLTMDEMTGGTFTITNGGVFGSLMSTPILNPPQSAILGMHKIEKRPVVIDDQIVIKPMMYVALSYDHRLVDGRDSVQFLVAIKQAIEQPERLLLDI